MKYRCSKFFPILLVLFVLTSCGQTSGKTTPQQGMLQQISGVMNIPPILDSLFKEGWPFDQAPAELPEYTSGKVTASVVDSDGALIIKVSDTSKADFLAYLDTLQRAGWIVTSNDTDAEALFELYTVRFDLQRDDTILQITVYTEDVGSWPIGNIPPDILEPMSGVLVGVVNIQQTGETMWYFDYTYDGIDEVAAFEYMSELLKGGWRGDVSQVYKTLEWDGKHYEASIEIYETIETRTTFTCNFYLIES